MNHKNSKNNNINIHYQRGMTLIELMVVLSIFVVVTGLTIFDYNSFRSNISLQNLASDISLSIRKAQGYAIGVRGTGDLYSYAYGVHFTTNSNQSDPLSGSNKSFVGFIDKFTDSGVSINNKIYNYGLNDTTCGGDNECNEILNITTNDKILGIYLNGETDPISPNDSVDISFLRPNPDALFCYRSNNSDLSCTRDDISHIRIKISNGLTGKNELTKEISVWNTGQISTL